MKHIIIFDFNRTLYDPESKTLVRNTQLVLRILLRRGFTLYLVSRADGSRDKLIDDLGLGQYFARITFTSNKSTQDIQDIIAPEDIDCSSSFVVGDRVRQEIAFGNMLGLQTIWVRSGKFSDEFPRTVMEQPTHSVNALIDVLSIAL